MTPRRVVIVGAGMSGLVAAYEILEAARRRDLNPPPDVVLLESASRPGGNIQTERDPEAGFLCEWGPEGFLDNVPETLDLAWRIGKADRVVRANPAATKRFVVRDGRLRLVPMNPPRFLLSDILPLRQRLRVFWEPFARPPRDPQHDETVYEFAARRIGPGAAGVLVDAMVSGVYAGDARALSLQSAFPKMHRMEREYGSLVKAMIARRKEAKRTGRKSGGPAGPGGTIASFPAGMEELVEGLVAAVGEQRIRFNAPVEAIERGASAGDRAGPAMVVLGTGERLDTDVVIVTVPSGPASELFRRSDPDLSRPLSEIPTASIAVVVTGHRCEDVDHPLDGFGFLFPRSEGRQTLGTLWPASTFPGRAPEGHTLLRTMIGGATDPGAVDLDDAALLAVVREEVNPLVGVRGKPVWTRIFRFRRGIPQYTVGHVQRLARIQSRLAEWPSLFLAGTSYYGIAVNSVCERTPALAQTVLDFLGPAAETGSLPRRLF